MSGSIGTYLGAGPYREPDLQRYDYEVVVCTTGSPDVSQTAKCLHQTLNKVAKQGFRLHSVTQNNHCVIYTFEKEHTP